MYVNARVCVVQRLWLRVLYPWLNRHPIKEGKNPTTGKRYRFLAQRACHDSELCSSPLYLRSLPSVPAFLFSRAQFSDYFPIAILCVSPNFLPSFSTFSLPLYFSAILYRFDGSFSSYSALVLTFFYDYCCIIWLLYYYLRDYYNIIIYIIILL